MSLEILYQDAHLIAIHKPAGLLVHRSPLDRHATRFALQLLRDQIGQRVYPAHRLDKPTSGILLFSLHADIARTLTEAFTCRQVRKRYLAVVRGQMTEAGQIDYPLADPDGDPQRRHVAQTDYWPLAQVELPYPNRRYPTSRYSLVALEPHGGRRHQLRQHMKHMFHPILGDTTHGDGTHNRIFRERLQCHRLLLAATDLAFTHPVSGQWLQISAPPADEMQQALRQCGWPGPWRVGQPLNPL